jgi:hypothetical protein
LCCCTDKARQGKASTSLFVDVHGEQPGSELNSRRGAQPASQCSGADSEDLFFRVLPNLAATSAALQPTLVLAI